MDRRIKRVALCVVSACLVGLAACGDPHDQPLPNDLANWQREFKSTLERLTPEERDLLAAYVARHRTIPTILVPPGTTVAQALADQRKVAAEDARKAAEAKAQQDKIAQARETWRARFNEALTVDYAGKHLDEAGMQGELLAISLNLTNRGKKEIASFKGTVVFVSEKGVPITHEALEYKKAIPAGRSVSESLRLYRLRDPVYKNPDLSADKMRFHYRPTEIVFADGSKLVMPKDLDQ